LIELLLAVALMAVLATAVVASLTGRRDRYALKVSGEDLAAALRFAAEEARATGRTHRVVFADQGAAFHVQSLQPAPAGFEPAKGLAGRSRPMGGGVRMASVRTGGRSVDPNQARLRFEGDGSGFAGTIVLENARREQLVVEVIPGSGQVHVHP